MKRQQKLEGSMSLVHQGIFAVEFFKICNELNNEKKKNQTPTPSDHF